MVLTYIMPRYCNVMGRWPLSRLLTEVLRGLQYQNSLVHLLQKATRPHPRACVIFLWRLTVVFIVVGGSIYSPPLLLFPIFLINTLSYVLIPRLISLLDPSSWFVLHPSFYLIRSNKSALYPSSLSCLCLRIREQILATMKGKKHDGY